MSVAKNNLRKRLNFKKLVLVVLLFFLPTVGFYFGFKYQAKTNTTCPVTQESTCTAIFTESKYQFLSSTWKTIVNQENKLEIKFPYGWTANLSRLTANDHYPRIDLKSKDYATGNAYPLQITKGESASIGNVDPKGVGFPYTTTLEFLSKYYSRGNSKELNNYRYIKLNGNEFYCAENMDWLSKGYETFCVASVGGNLYTFDELSASQDLTMFYRILSTFKITQ
jgi:hypothetical protein